MVEEMPSPKVKKAPSTPAPLVVHPTQPSVGTSGSAAVIPVVSQPLLEFELVVELVDVVDVVDVATVLVATVEPVVEPVVVAGAPVVVPEVVVVVVVCPTVVLVA